MAKELSLDELQFIETSAKTGINVKQLFKNLATTLPGVKDKEGEKSTQSLGGERGKINE